MKKNNLTQLLNVPMCSILTTENITLRKHAKPTAQRKKDVQKFYMLNPSVRII